MMKSNFYLFIFTALFFTACELDNSGSVDDFPSPPVLIGATVIPSYINVEGISSTVQIVDTTIMIQATLDKGYSENIQVHYIIKYPDGSIISSGNLLDNGNSPDQTISDGIYSAIQSFRFPKSTIGKYTVTLFAQNEKSEQSVQFISPLSVVNSANNPPELSALAAPDTVIVPTGSNPTLIKISVTAADSQGLADIVSVSLRSVRPNGTVVGTFPLFDDGSATIQPTFNITSGDSIANDGRYTLTIPIFNTTEKNTYRDFEFIAVDRSNAKSNAIIKRVYIK